MKRVCLAVLLACWASLCAAASPINVSADSFVIDEAIKQATFSGNVAISREGMQLWADKVVIDYGSGGVNDIKTFVATGAVRIKTKDQSATGSKAVFVPDTQILTISGNVKVDNAMGTLTGPELVIDLATNSSVFTGGSGGRVTGVFTPQ
jgi:lipopolysaccharide export system protein LptA